VTLGHLDQPAQLRGQLACLACGVDGEHVRVFVAAMKKAPGRCAEGPFWMRVQAVSVPDALSPPTEIGLNSLPKCHLLPSAKVSPPDATPFLLTSCRRSGNSL
jgi:hypothetical protein